MDSPVARAVDVYREEGVRSLAVQSARYSVNQSLAWLRAGYWQLRGVRPVTVGGTTARFTARTLQESRELGFLADNERAVVADLLASLEPDDVLHDVGAHVGFYSCFAGRAGADVVAFEPYPPNVERLRANLARNEVAATVCELALSNERGEVGFERPSTDTPGWSRAAIATDGTDGATVSTANGDRLVTDGEVPAPTVVKLDVEGAEGRVIEGYRETLARDDCRLVYCEVHRPERHRQSVEDYGDSGEFVRSTLAELEFDVEVIHDREAEVTLRGRK